MAGEDDAVRNIRIWPLSAELAEALRIVCTNLGLFAGCPFSPCKRQKRCATRQVVCWQALRYEINPLINRALAYDWQAWVAAGVVPDIPPAREQSLRRILAREREENPEEAARLAAEAARAVAAKMAERAKAERKAAAAVDAKLPPPVTARTSPPLRSRRKRGTGPPAARG